MSCKTKQKVKCQNESGHVKEVCLSKNMTWRCIRFANITALPTKSLLSISILKKKKNNEPPQNGLPSLSLEWLSSHNSKHSTESPKTATFFTKLHRFIVAGTI